MDKTTQKKERRKRIQRRIRSSIRGTSERPRLSVYKSNKHVYAQLVNDLLGETLASVSTKDDAVASEIKDKEKQEQAEYLGDHIAGIAEDKGIEKAVFDRSGYKYHGIIKALAEGAREGGLDF